MQLNKETLFSLIRVLAGGFGAYLIGANTSIFGNPLDAQLWEALVGVAITAISVGWGIKDKTANEESLRSALSSIVTVIGGLFVASGRIKAEVVVSVLGLIGIIVPWIMGENHRQTLRKIQENELKVVKAPGNISSNRRFTLKKVA